MTVFTFRNKAPGGGITCVSAASLEDAYGILKKNAYADCDVHQRYELQPESERAGEGRGPSATPEPQVSEDQATTTQFFPNGCDTLGCCSPYPHSHGVLHFS